MKTESLNWQISDRPFRVLRGFKLHQMGQLAFAFVGFGCEIFLDFFLFCRSLEFHWIFVISKLERNVPTHNSQCAQSDVSKTNINISCEQFCLAPRSRKPDVNVNYVKPQYSYTTEFRLHGIRNRGFDVTFTSLALPST